MHKFYTEDQAIAMQQQLNVKRTYAKCMHDSTTFVNNSVKNVFFAYTVIDYATATYEARKAFDMHKHACEDTFDLLVHNKHGNVLCEDVGGYTRYFTDEKLVAYYDYENYSGHIAQQQSTLLN